METKISTTGQHELFDVDAHRWEKLPVRCRKDIETLLTQLFIQALQEQTVIPSQENSHASQSEAEPFRENRLSLSAAIESATTH